MIKEVYNLLILDESGSMSDIADKTISSYNELIQTVRNAEKKYKNQKQFLTLVTFNTNGIKIVFDKVPIRKAYAFEAKDYNPDDMTPLWDAVGISISNLKNFLINKKQFAVFVSILTDGFENASREFTPQQIKKLIGNLSTKNWVFSFIGATADVFKQSDELGIRRGNTMRFSPDKLEEASEKLGEGMDNFFAKVTKCTGSITYEDLF